MRSHLPALTLLLSGCLAAPGAVDGADKSVPEDPFAEDTFLEEGATGFDDPWLGSEEASGAPWAQELAGHVTDVARLHGYGEAMVAGPGAGQASCVGAWAVGGAAVGEVASTGCWTVGLVAAETGGGLVVAGVCGVADVTQIDWLIGAIIGAAAGLVACSLDTSVPTEVAPEYRYHDVENDRTLDRSTAASWLRNEQCPANDAGEANRDCWLYFHYRGAGGFANIASTGVIRANAQNVVYLTWIPYSPAEAETAVYVGSTTHEGRADFLIAFRKADSTLTFEPGTQWNELIHYGSLRFGRHITPVYMGPNPF